MATANLEAYVDISMLQKSALKDHATFNIALNVTQESVATFLTLVIASSVASAPFHMKFQTMSEALPVN